MTVRTHLLPSFHHRPFPNHLSQWSELLTVPKHAVSSAIVGTYAFYHRIIPLRTFVHFSHLLILSPPLNLTLCGYGNGVRDGTLSIPISGNTMTGSPGIWYIPTNYHVGVSSDVSQGPFHAISLTADVLR